MRKTHMLDAGRRAESDRSKGDEMTNLGQHGDTRIAGGLNQKVLVSP
jgi:hypothetical protein